jgi:hypothetical protein
MNIEAEARRRIRALVKKIKVRKGLDTVTGVRNSVERRGGGFMGDAINGELWR